MDFDKKPGLLWTPVRTKPRREKKLAEYCAAKGIGHYLPLRRTLHRYERRTVEFMVPMFPGYLFCRLNAELYQTLVKSHSVLFKISIEPEVEDSLIAELSMIKSLEELSKDSEIIVNPELVEGVKVKIRAGPLRGIAGFVEKRKGRTVVTVNVEILGQSVSMEMDAGDLEAEAD